MVEYQVLRSIVPSYMTEMCLDEQIYVFRVQYYLRKDLLVSFENRKLKFVLDWPMADDFVEFKLISSNATFNRLKHEKRWNVYLHFKERSELNGSKKIFVEGIISDQISHEIEECPGNIYNSETLSENWEKISKKIENYVPCCKNSTANFRKKNDQFDFLRNDKIHVVIHYVQNVTFFETQLKLQILPSLLQGNYQGLENR